MVELRVAKPACTVMTEAKERNGWLAPVQPVSSPSCRGLWSQWQPEWEGTQMQVRVWFGFSFQLRQGMVHVGVLEGCVINKYTWEWLSLFHRSTRSPICIFWFYRIPTNFSFFLLFPSNSLFPQETTFPVQNSRNIPRARARGWNGRWGLGEKMRREK